MLNWASARRSSAEIIWFSLRIRMAFMRRWLSMDPMPSRAYQTTISGRRSRALSRKPTPPPQARAPPSGPGTKLVPTTTHDEADLFVVGDLIRGETNFTTTRNSLALLHVGGDGDGLARAHRATVAGSIHADGAGGIGTYVSRMRRSPPCDANALCRTLARAARQPWPGAWGPRCAPPPPPLKRARQMGYTRRPRQYQYELLRESRAW